MRHDITLRSKTGSKRFEESSVAQGTHPNLIIFMQPSTNHDIRTDELYLRRGKTG